MARTGYRRSDTDGTNRNKPNKGRGYHDHRNAEFAGWVNVTIPDSRKSDFTEFETSTAFPDALDAIGTANIRLTVVREAGQDNYVANAFRMDESRSDAGLMVSQRSGFALRALAKLAFCIVELMPDDWSELLDKGSGDW